jgi:hypothetical protein
MNASDFITLNTLIAGPSTKADSINAVDNVLPELHSRLVSYKKASPAIIPSPMNYLDMYSLGIIKNLRLVMSGAKISDGQFTGTSQLLEPVACQQLSSNLGASNVALIGALPALGAGNFSDEAALVGGAVGHNNNGSSSVMTIASGAAVVPSSFRTVVSTKAAINGRSAIKASFMFVASAAANATMDAIVVTDEYGKAIPISSATTTANSGDVYARRDILLNSVPCNKTIVFSTTVTSDFAGSLVFTSFASAWVEITQALNLPEIDDVASDSSWLKFFTSVSPADQIDLYMERFFSLFPSLRHTKEVWEVLRRETYEQTDKYPYPGNYGILEPDFGDIVKWIDVFDREEAFKSFLGAFASAVERWVYARIFIVRS